jgi:Mrp family chromosome partitioning ATPase/capsular polysaccharide biosynthesis protein
VPEAFSKQTPSGDAPSRLSDYTRPLRDRLLLIIGLSVAVVVATYVYYDRKPDVFVSSTSIFLSSSSPNPLSGTATGIDDRTTLSQATLLTTQAVAVRVAKQLRFASPGALRGAVKATPTAGSNFINIKATWSTAQGAADIANAFAKEFISTQSEQQRTSAQSLLTRLRNQLQQIPATVAQGASRAELQAQIRQLELSLQLPANVAQQVDSASAPGFPIEPRPKRNAVFAGLLAFLAAVGIAYGLDRFDRRIRRAEDAPEAYRLPVLSVVPHVDQFGPGGLAPAGFVEAFRLLQTNLRLAQVDRPVKVILIVSAIPGEGKSTVVRYLAEAYSEWGKSVAVIDADLRRPSLTRLYGVAAARGLTDLVSSASLNGSTARALVEVERPRIGGSGADAGGTERATPTVDRKGEIADPVAVGSVAAMPTAQNGAAQPGSELAPIHVLPAGVAPPNPAALLASGRTRQLIKEISDNHDVVIIDTPPVLAVSDAISLVPLADAVIVVSRIGKTTRDEAERLVDALERIPDAQLMGIVANDDQDSVSGGDGYGYYYSG